MDKAEEWHEPGTFIVRGAEWRERRRELTEIIHRQRLISAAFGTVLPTMDDLMESYVWVVIEETGNLKAAADVLGIDPSTLFRWVDKWDRRDGLK